jgi:methyl-accepting chemotaxis protein
VTSWLGNRSIRVKVLIPVLLAALGIGVVAWSGLSALAAAGDRTQSMYAHVTKPLSDLVVLRDMEGDSRVEIRDSATGWTRSPRPRPPTVRPPRPPSTRSSAGN